MLIYNPFEILKSIVYCIIAFRIKMVNGNPFFKYLSIAFKMRTNFSLEIHFGNRLKEVEVLISFYFWQENL